MSVYARRERRRLLAAALEETRAVEKQIADLDRRLDDERSDRLATQLGLVVPPR